MAGLKIYPSIRLEGVRKTTRNLSQSQDRNLKAGPPEFEPSVMHM
jgi:hypothetical protein